MIDFSDIFEEGKDEEKGSSSQEEGKEASPREDNDQDKQDKPSQPPLEFSSVSDKKELTPADKSSQEEDVPAASSSTAGEQKVLSQAEKVYNRTVAFAEKLFSPEKELTSSDVRQAPELIGYVLDYMLGNEQQLVEYVFRQLSSSADVLALNLVNVCLLSLEVGFGLGYGRPQLLKLGLAAFLHDIGMEIKGMEISEYLTKESIAQQGGYGLATKGAQHDEAWLIFMDQIHNLLPTDTGCSIRLTEERYSLNDRLMVGGVFLISPEWSIL